LLISVTESGWPDAVTGALINVVAAVALPAVLVLATGVPVVAAAPVVGATFGDAVAGVVDRAVAAAMDDAAAVGDRGGGRAYLRRRRRTETEAARTECEREQETSDDGK